MSLQGLLKTKILPSGRMLHDDDKESEEEGESGIFLPESDADDDDSVDFYEEESY